MAAAQKKPARQSIAPLTYTAIHYTDENGLPQNSIKDIVCDRYGFIWLACEAGLIRYDGRQFQLFSKEAMGTRHARVYIMGRWVHGGNLFASTEAWDWADITVNGQSVFAPQPAFIGRYFGSDILLGPQLRQEFFPESGGQRILIPTRADSFYSVKRTAGVYEVSFGTVDRTLWQTRVTGEKGRWPLYWQGRKLYVYNKSSGRFFQITSEGIRPDASVGSFQKMIWNKGEEQTFLLTPDRELRLLYEDAQGQLTSKPLLRNIPRDFEAETAFYMEERGIVLLGSLRTGLLVCKKKSFFSLYTDRPDMMSVFYGIYPTDDNRMITVRGEILDRTGKISSAGLPLDPGRINFSGVARTADGKFLIGSRNLLYTYSPDGKKFPPVHLGDEVGAVSTDHEGRVWVATRDSGIFEIGADRVPRKTVELSPKTIVRYLKEPVNGLLFIGTDNGLYIYNKEKRTLNRFPGTERYYIRSIFLSTGDKLYLCTYGDGIILLDRNGLVPLPIDRREYLKMAHCMLQDKKGRLWITTNKGLFCVPETDLIRYAEGKTSYVYYYRFSKENGFATNEFNGGCQPCGIRMNDGSFVFPSLNGLMFFNPDSVLFHFPQGDLQVKTVAVNDTVVTRMKDTLTVSRDFKRIEISLTTPLFDPDQNLFIEYSFDTASAESWASVPLNGPLTFTSMRSGYSVLTFRVKEGFGTAQYRYLWLTIYKPRALWEYPAFWIAVPVLLLVGVYIYLRLRTRKLNRRNRELSEAVELGRHELMATIHSLTETSDQLERKNRFQQWLISSVVHDLRGPLRFMKFGDVQRDDEVPTPEKFAFLKSVYFSAQKIYAYSENLIQLLRIEQNSGFPPEKTDFMQLAEDKIDQFREQAKWNGISIVLLPESDPFLMVNTTALSIIVQNLLDNSVKNFKNGHIYLCLKNEKNHAVISIRDEGWGLSPEQLQRFNRPVLKEISGGSSGMGLWLVRSVVMQTGGRIRFENVENPKGLLVTLTWPQPEENE